MSFTQINPHDLRQNTWNVNRMAPENEAKLDESLKRLTIFKPILVRDTVYGLEIIGGAHRVESAIRLGMPTVPVWNLGVISDQKAKEISLVDNESYGQNDTLALADLLAELGDADELASFLPYSDAEMTAIFASKEIDFDSLDDVNEPTEPAPPSKTPKTQTIMRFKVAIGDAERIEAAIQAAIKSQDFTHADELTNAGDALVFLITNEKEDK